MIRVVMMACFGMLLILLDLEERIGLAGIGLACLVGALLLYRLDVHTPSPEECDSRVRRTPEGVEIGLSNTLPEVRTTFPLLGSACCFYLAYLLSYDPSWRYGGIAVGVGLLVLVPDGALALARGGHLRITTRGLEYYGWNAGLSLAWEDVAAARPPFTTQRNASLSLALQPGTTLIVQRRFLVLPIDYAAWGGRRRRAVLIASASLDEPGLVAALAAMLIEYPPRSRSAIIDIWVDLRRVYPAERFAYEFRSAVYDALPPWDHWR